MIRYKATDEYAHFGEVYLINGKGYALHWEIDNSAPCGHCALFNNVATDTERMCMHPDKDKRMCKHESGTSKGWNTYEYVHIPDGNIMPYELATLTKKDLLEAIEDMPMDTPIVIFYAGVYEDVEDIRMHNLYDTKDINKHSEKCICLYFEESC